MEWTEVVTAVFGIAAILTTILISAPEADGRRVNSQKFDKVFTNQTLEHYARHVVRGVAECTSMCISDKLVDCKAFSLRESLTRSKECLLYDTTIVSLVTYESSAHSFSVHVKRAMCEEGYHLNPYSLSCFQSFCCSSWSRAKEFCEARGEHLLTFPSIESADWFYNFTQTSTIDIASTWIGLKWTDGEWRREGLTSGVVSTSDSRWRVRQPSYSEDGYCAYEYYKGTSRGFRSIPCFNNLYVICEKAATGWFIW